jgi:protein TonB
MDTRKTEKADLENKRGIYTQIGLVIALGLTLLAFEWKQYERAEIVLATRDNVEVMEEVIIQTEQKEKPPAPTPPPQTTILQIVEDNVNIDDDIVIDAEMDQNTEVEEYIAPEVTKVEEEEIEEAEIFTVVEESPSYPGGDAARIKFLQENIEYPQMARESGIQGTVYVTFVVEPDGRVSGVRVLRGIGGGCDEEAIRVVQKMPKWNPGKQRGKPVRVQFNMPIKFTLQG